MSSEMKFGDTQKLSELRIVLMGYKGAGKSSSGNIILNREEFDLKTTAQCVKRQREVADRHITVIEAPGWWRTIPVDQSCELLKQEILLSVSLCPPGPHVVLLVIRVDTTFKEDMRKVYQGYVDLLGERVWSHTIVLFTHGDFLGDTSIELHIESEGEDLQWLVEKCGNRYHVLNNNNRSDDTQIKDLLEKIEETVMENNGCHFEIDRKILQELEEKKRADEERAKERMRRMNERREMSRSQMISGVDSKPAWSVGSSAYGSLGSLSQTSSYSPVHEWNLRKRHNSMEIPSPFMSGDEQSDSMSARSSVYSTMKSPSEADEDSS